MICGSTSGFWNTPCKVAPHSPQRAAGQQRHHDPRQPHRPHHLAGDAVEGRKMRQLAKNFRQA
ncbi:Uncharacterised protein [Klebsiella michiganensis]|nr:Uncharacterised protein [Klebsiella michiganensis]